MDHFRQILGQMETRMNGLSPQDRVSFSKWLEYVISAVTESTNKVKGKAAD